MGQKPQGRNNFTFRQPPCCRYLKFSGQNYFSKKELLVSNLRLSNAEKAFISSKMFKPNAQKISLKEEVALAAKEPGIENQQIQKPSSDFITSLESDQSKRQEMRKLGDEELAKGNALNAIAAYHYALGHSADIFDPNVLVNMGIAKYDAGFIEDAESYFTEALSQNPVHFEALFNRAIARYSMGIADIGTDEGDRMLRLSIKDLKGAISVRPESENALFQLGIVLTALNNLYLASEAYAAASKMCGKLMVRSLIECGRCLEALGNADEALYYYYKAVDEESWNADAHMRIGRIHYFDGNFEAAVRELSEADRLRPMDLQTLFFLGNSFLETGRIEAAIRCFDDVISVEPDFAQARYDLAFALYRAGDFFGAISEYYRAIAHSPNLEGGRFIRKISLN